MNCHHPAEDHFVILDLGLEPLNDSLIMVKGEIHIDSCLGIPPFLNERDEMEVCSCKIYRNDGL